MDPNFQFLLGKDAPKSDGATIHSISTPSPDSTDDDKIGFTLDVAARLDREHSEEIAREGVVVPLVDPSTTDLADTA